MNNWGRDREVEKPKTKTEQVADYQKRARAIADKLETLTVNRETAAVLLSVATVNEAIACLRIAAAARRLSL